MKIEQNELSALLGFICSHLDEQGLSFHFTGGLVSSYYGEPRFTQDVDLVIVVPGREAVNNLVEAFSERFSIDGDYAWQCVEQGRMFQALDLETLIKVDFHVGEGIAGELGRSVEVELFPSVTVPIASLEDAILSKLLWISKGSEKGRRDVEKMLLLGSDIDMEFLRTEAQKMGLLSTLNSFIID